MSKSPKCPGNVGRRIPCQYRSARVIVPQGALADALTGGCQIFLRSAAGSVQAAAISVQGFSSCHLQSDTAGTQWQHAP